MNTRSSLFALLAAALCSTALAQADPRCVIHRPQAENGATVSAELAVKNDGMPCEMRVRLGGHAATSLTVRARPVNGTLTVESSSVSYTPNPGFAGKDVFDVQWFGIGFGPNSRSSNLRTKVDVTVRATDDKSAV